MKTHLLSFFKHLYPPRAFLFYNGEKFLSQAKQTTVKQFLWPSPSSINISYNLNDTNGFAMLSVVSRPCLLSLNEPD